MKAFFIACAAFLLAIPTVAAGDTPSPQGPLAEPRPFDIYLGLEPKRIHSESPLRGTHTFPSVLQGDHVHHVFTIENPTEAPIEITGLRLCSGCMLESRSRMIPPGAKGHVAFVIPTDSLGGQSLSGPVRVQTNHPDYPELVAHVFLQVRSFAEVEPYRIWLRGQPGEAIEAEATILPNPDYPFKIRRIRARKGLWIRWELEEIAIEGRPGFRIKVSNTRQKPGPYQDVLFIQTDHAERPEFKVRVEGRIAPPQ